MKALEIYFEFAKLKTTWRQEAIAGLTTFPTMAYSQLRVRNTLAQPLND